MHRLWLLPLQNLAPGVDPADRSDSAEVDFLDSEAPSTCVQDDASRVVSLDARRPLRIVFTVAVVAWSARPDWWGLAGRRDRSGWRGRLALRRGIDARCRIRLHGIHWRRARRGIVRFAAGLHGSRS